MTTPILERTLMRDSEPLDLTTARRVLAAQPFSQLLGAELTAFGDGYAELRIPLPDEHRQQDGVAHGGVLSYAADNVLTFAAGAAVGSAVWTAGFTIDYLAPATGPPSSQEDRWSAPAGDSWPPAQRSTISTRTATKRSAP